MIKVDSDPIEAARAIDRATSRLFAVVTDREIEVVGEVQFFTLRRGDEVIYLHDHADGYQGASCWWPDGGIATWDAESGSVLIGDFPYKHGAWNEPTERPSLNGGCS